MSLSWEVIALCVATFACGLALGAAAAARARARVRRVREGVAELARGNLGHRIILPGDDDAARMALDLNVLADAFQQEREAAGARDAARRKLLANISHDLRTPITSVAGYVDALQRGLGDDPERYLAVIAAKTDELATLTDDLFYEARMDAGDLDLKLNHLDLAEAVRRLMLGFEPELVRRGLHVDVSIPDRACPVEADASAVARILGNLMSNALRHGQEMTSLSISMADDGDECIICLANNGADLPPDTERLFERGVAGRGGGAGLGLAIARELAGRMGATIGIERVGVDSVAASVAFPKARTAG